MFRVGHPALWSKVMVVAVFLLAVLVGCAGIGAVVTGCLDEQRRRAALPDWTGVRWRLYDDVVPIDDLEEDDESDEPDLMAEIEEWLRQQQ